MRTSDGRTNDEIRQVFQWANADHFWKTNILSPRKLRKQFSQVKLKMQAENERPHRNGDADDDQPLVFAGQRKRR
jgi:hypothetical protein